MSIESTSRHNPQLLTLPQLVSAKQKIGHAAAFYDPQSQALKQFTACDTMTPTEFRQALNKSFNITLSDEELGATVVYLDNTGMREVACEEFVKEFFILGKGEKHKISYRHKQELQRRHDRVMKWKKQQAATLSKLTSSKVDTKFSEKDHVSALDKIGKVAFDYDKTKGGLQCFMDTLTLSGAEFKELLRLNLNIILTAKETGAMLSYLDSKRVGLIDCKSFIIEFNRVGRIQRQQLQQQQAKRKQHHEVIMSHIQTSSLHLLPASDDDILSCIVPYSEDDFISFQKKIYHVSLSFTMNDAERVKHVFDHKQYMILKDFLAFLHDFFHMALSPGEMDVARIIFDKNQDQVITCTDFLATFYRIQWRAKAKQKRYDEMKMMRRNKQERDYWKKREDVAVKMLQTHVIWPDIGNDDDKISSSPASSSLLLPAIHHQPSTSSSDNHHQIRSSSSSSHHHRKQKVEDSFSAGRYAETLAASSESITTMFPNASSMIKDFILELEQKEQEMMYQHRDVSSPSPMKSSSHDKMITSSKDDDNIRNRVSLPPISPYLDMMRSSSSSRDHSASGWDQRPASVHSSRHVVKSARLQSQDSDYDEDGDRKDRVDSAMSVADKEDVDKQQHHPNTLNSSFNLMAEMSLLFDQGDEEDDNYDDDNVELDDMVADESMIEERNDADDDEVVDEEDIADDEEIADNDGSASDVISEDYDIE